MVVAACLAQAGPAQARSAGSALERAERLVEEGSYSAGLAATKEALQGCGDDDRRTHSRALALRARAFTDLGRWAEAEAELRQALRVLAGSAHADCVVQILTTAGILDELRGDVVSARERFREASVWDAALTGSAEPRGESRLLRSRGRLALATGHADQALRLFREAARRCPSATTGACRVRAVVGEGQALLATGEPVGARRRLTESQAEMAALGLAPERAAALVLLAQAHELLGELPQAVARSEQALALGRRLAHLPVVADAHRLRARLALATGATDLAREHAEAAQASYLAMGSWPGQLACAAIRGSIAASTGDLAEARAQLGEALAGSESLADAPGALAARIRLAEVAGAEGRAAEELALLRAVEAAGGYGPEAWRASERLGELLLARGERDEARRVLDDAAARGEHLEGTHLTLRERQRLHHGRQRLYDLLIRAWLGEEGAVAGEEVARALEASERNVAGRFLDGLDRSRMRTTHPRVAGLLRELDAVERDEVVAASAGSMNGRAAGGRAGRQASGRGRAVPRTRLEGLARQRAALEEEILAAAPRVSWSRPGLFRSRIERLLASARRSLQGDVAIVEYHLAEGTSHAFVVAGERVAAVPLEGRTTVRALVRDLLGVLRRPARRAADRGQRAELAARLYDVLLAPVIGHLGDRRRLVIVPGDELHRLPFEALIIDRGDGRTAPTHALERFTFSSAPSIAAVVELHSDAAHRHPEPQRHPLLAFADPVYDGQDRHLQRLPGSAREVERAGQHLEAGAPGPGTLFLRGDATEENLKALALDRYRIVHLAAHGGGGAEDASPGGAGLHLGRSGGEDGVLRVGEVFDLALDADLVVLSACASGDDARGEEDESGGLAEAFLHAGSSAVLASLWAVEDSSTARLMEIFYRGLANGRGPPEALRDARLALLTEATGPTSRLRGIGGIIDPTVGDGRQRRRHRARRPARTGDPFFWASFVLIGDSGDILR